MTVLPWNGSKLLTKKFQRIGSQIGEKMKDGKSEEKVEKDH
jgi:hypothetical protein